MADRNPWRPADRAEIQPGREQDTEQDAHERMGREQADLRNEEQKHTDKQRELAERLAQNAQKD